MIRLPTRSPRLTHSFPPRRSSDLEQELSKRLSIQRNRLRCVPGTSERNRLCQRLNLGEQGRLANRRPQIARQAMHQTTFDEQIGRAHVWTPVTNAPLVCRLLLETKNTYNRTSDACAYLYIY